jgi:hypothetical protein
MNNKCVKKINNIIEDLDKKNEKEAALKTEKLFNIVINFIAENRFIVYGGFAMNTYLPKDKKIYDDNTVNDLDCYCLNPKLEAKKISDLLAKNGYKYIEVKQSSSNKDVYKLFVEFIPICDFNKIELEDYNYYMNMNHNKKIKKLFIIPKEILKYNMLKELSSPNTSYYRWEKTYERYNHFIKVFKDTVKMKVEKKYAKENIKKYLDYLLNYIKKEKYPLLGIQGYELQKNKKKGELYILNYVDTFIEILVKDSTKIIKDIEKNINDVEIIEKKNVIEIRYENISLLKIYKLESECITYCNINNYRVVTLYGILQYLYKNYIDNYFSNHKTTKFLISEVSKLIKKTDCINDCLLTTECYGKAIDIKQLRKNVWNERFMRYRPEISNNNKSLFTIKTNK